MLTMDVFNQDAFSAISLTEAVQTADSVPGLIGSLNLFTPKPVRTRLVAVERKGKVLNIIQTSEPGAPRNTRGRDRPTIRDFRVRRLDTSSKITAEMLQGMRAFGSETELQTLSNQIAEDQQGMMDDLQASIERLRLGTAGGILVDADDTTIYDFYAEFGFSQPAEIAFDWLNKTKVKSFIAQNVIRPMVRAIGGIAPPGMRILALCGDAFFDDMQENAEYKARYLQTENASKLVESTVFEAVEAWGVTWLNYRGTDDNSTVAINSDKVKFIPLGVRNLFQEALAPAPSFDTVNTLGLPWYSRVIADTKRNEYVDVELDTYRLPICTRPEALLRGKRGA